MTNHAIIYFFSFVGIWIGSGLAIRSVERLSKILGISSFAVSFLVLGTLSSLSELSVGVNSILEDTPKIYVGNLIGASIVIFTLIIPLLTLSGKKIRIHPRFQGFNLPASLVVVALPAFLVLDGKVDQIDGWIAIGVFLFLVIGVQMKKEMVGIKEHYSQRTFRRAGKELLRVAFGAVIIFVSSKFLVNETQYFSQVLGIPQFLISLVLISLGTNVPELSLAVRSLAMKNNRVAFGGYVGSSAINTLLFGVLTVVYGKNIILDGGYMVFLVFFILALFLFYRFAKSKNSISRQEGLALILLYIILIISESLLPRLLS